MSCNIIEIYTLIHTVNVSQIPNVTNSLMSLEMDMTL